MAARRIMSLISREVGLSSFPLRRFRFCVRGFHSIPVPESTSPFSTNPSLNSNLTVSFRQNLPIMFTCKACGVRSTKSICKESYEKGMVIGRCDECHSLHLIVDRLGLIEESKSSSLDEYLSARGVHVKKFSLETFNLALKDLAGVGSSLSDRELSKAVAYVRSRFENEKYMQLRGLELIASESYTSRAVMEAVGSCYYRTSVKRYYIKSLKEGCEGNALRAFKLKWKKWGVNIQPISVSSANFEVYTAILRPDDRIMGLDLPQGSVSDKRRVSGKSVSFESMPFRLDESTGLIDYDNLEKEAALFRPKLIIAGARFYPRDFDYPRLRKIADGVGAFLMMDMSHVSGLVSAKALENPFEFCDIVTTSTHKSLRGPRGSIIFFKKETVLGVDLESALNDAVCPSSQEGPHAPTITGIEVCLRLAKTPEFKAYQNKMISNARALAGRLVELGYKIVSGGTDNHLVLVDIRPLGICSARVERFFDNKQITLSKHSVPGDDEKRVLVPGGILMSSSAMTIRGFKEDHFVQVADIIHEAMQIALEANRSATGSKLSDFTDLINSHEFPLKKRAFELFMRARELVEGFPIPGL